MNWMSIEEELPILGKPILIYRTDERKVHEIAHYCDYREAWIPTSYYGTIELDKCPYWCYMTIPSKQVRGVKP